MIRLRATQPARRAPGCSIVLLSRCLLLGRHLAGRAPRRPARRSCAARSSPTSSHKASSTKRSSGSRDDYYRPISKDAARRTRRSRAWSASLGDRFSHYLPPSEFREFNPPPHFTGIGVQVGPAATRACVIARVFDSSPAARAGLKAGELIVAVNGRTLRGPPADAAVALIKGPPGTDVTLAVEAPPQGARAHGARARVKITPRDDLRAGRRLRDAHRPRREARAWSRSPAFSPGAHAEVREAVEHALHAGARGIVLDLRDNGGGLVEEAQLIASIFIPKGTIVTTRGRTQPTQTLIADRRCDLRRRSRWSCSSTPTPPRPRRSSPPRCRTTTARPSSARTPSARASSRRRSRSPTAARSTSRSASTSRPTGATSAAAASSRAPGVTPEVPVPHGVDTAQGLAVALGTLAAKVPRLSSASAAPRAQARGRGVQAPGRWSCPACAGRAHERGGARAARALLTAEPLFAVATPRGRRRECAGRAASCWARASRPCRRAARAGDIVLVQSANGGRGAGRSVARGLGRPDVARDVIEALMLDRGLAARFDAERGARGAARARERGMATDAQRAGATCASWPRSRSTRPAPATSTTRSPPSAWRRGGVRVWVHIADVAAHVAEGSRARPRGAPARHERLRARSRRADAAARALQRRLLAAARRDRLAVTVELELRGAEVARTAFYRSLIRSDARLDYERVDRIFAGASRPRSPGGSRWPPRARPPRRCQRSREQSGALVVDSEEPEFRFDEHGDVSEIRARAQTESHRLIEHLMIAANEAVAAPARAARRPLPVPRARAPRARARSSGSSTSSPRSRCPPRRCPSACPPRRRPSSWARSRACVERARAAHRAAAAIALGSLVLRSLKQAYYSPRNLGHAGPSLRAATATSPRRSAATPTSSATARCSRRSAAARARRAPASSPSSARGPPNASATR